MGHGRNRFKLMVSKSTITVTNQRAKMVTRPLTGGPKSAKYTEILVLKPWQPPILPAFITPSGSAIRRKLGPISLGLRVFKRNTANVRQPITRSEPALAGTARTASASQYGL
jgi:hypothetical protein